MGFSSGIKGLGRKIFDSTSMGKIWRGLNFVPRRPLAESIVNISKVMSPVESLSLLSVLHKHKIIHPKSQLDDLNNSQYFDLSKKIPLHSLHAAAREFSETSTTKISVEGFIFKVLIKPEVKQEIVIPLEKEKMNYTIPGPTGPIKITLIPPEAKDILDLFSRQKVPITTEDILHSKGIKVEKSLLFKILELLGHQGFVSPVLEATDETLSIKYILSSQLKKLKTDILFYQEDGEDRMTQIIYSDRNDFSINKQIVPIISREKIIYFSRSSFFNIFERDKADGKPTETFSEIFIKPGKKQYILTDALNEKLKGGKATFGLNKETGEEFPVLILAHNRFDQKSKFKNEIFQHEIKGIIIELQKKGKIDAESSDILIESVKLAFELLKGKKFPDGETYLDHVLKVAKAAEEIGADAITISAALLHKVEDKEITDETLRKKLRKVIELKNKLMRLEAVPYMPPPSGKFNIQNHMDMIIQMAGEGRALLLLLADKLETMRSEHRIKDDRKKAYIVREIRHIFGPLAERFGLRDLANDFYEQAFRLDNPQEFALIREEFVKSTGMGWVGAQTYLENLRRKILKTIDELGIKGRVLIRPKGYGSIYEKKQTEYESIEDIADLFGIRIITDAKTDAIEESIQLINLALEGQLLEINKEKTEVNPKLKIHKIGIFDRERRKIEIQVMNEEEYTKDQKGLFSHWAYKLFKLTNENFDREIFESYSKNWGDDFEGNFSLVLNSISPWIYVGSVEKGGKEEYIKIRRFRADSTPIDFAASYGVDKLNENFVGVRHGALSIDEDLKFNFGSLSSLSNTEALKTGDVLFVLTNGGRSFEIQKLLRNAKHLRTKVLLLKMNKEIYYKSLENGRSLLESAAFQKDKKFYGKMMTAARKLDLKTPEELLVALGSNLINEINFQTVKELLELEETKIHLDPSSIGPKTVKVDTIDRIGLIAAIIEPFKGLNLIHATCSISGPQLKRRARVELIFSVKNEKDLENYAGAKETLPHSLEKLPYKQADVGNTAFTAVEIPVKNRARILFDILSEFSRKEINILSLSLNTEESERKVLINLQLEMPKSSGRGLQRDISNSLGKVDGVFQEEIKFTES
ncbi:MAG: HD domain-containing protein [Candidatus Saganbacteria bacterium]|nr:HD domain-containing protein [Candidatus Saganbacteria bacterium]